MSEPTRAGVALRPNRVQPDVVRQELTDALGADGAREVMAEAGVDRLPAMLPAGPRDFGALREELRPFVKVYRALRRRLPPQRAFAVMRPIIVRSGAASLRERPAWRAPDGTPQISLTSPPDEPVPLTATEVQAAFRSGMAFMACEGELFRYDPDEVHFHVTRCAWHEAMQALGAPELTQIFCDTDAAALDGHPTHELVRPTTIAAGHRVCDFRYVRKDRRR